MMPVATKVMISKKKQREDAALVGHLKISKEDIKTMKLYNMSTVTENAIYKNRTSCFICRLVLFDVNFNYRIRLAVTYVFAL